MAASRSLSCVFRQLIIPSNSSCGRQLSIDFLERANNIFACRVQYPGRGKDFDALRLHWRFSEIIIDLHCIVGSFGKRTVLIAENLSFILLVILTDLV